MLCNRKGQAVRYYIEQYSYSYKLTKNKQLPHKRAGTHTRTHVRANSKDGVQNAHRNWPQVSI